LYSNLIFHIFWNKSPNNPVEGNHVLEKHAVSILRLIERAKQVANKALLPASCFVYSIVACFMFGLFSDGEDGYRNFSKTW
jgi:hypothetical protein